MSDKRIINALKKVFPKTKLPKNIDNLKIGSFAKWDSLAHLNFLLLVEKEFKIKFSISEMTNLKKIKDIKNIINSKI